MSDTRDVRALLAEHGPTEDVYLYCMCGHRCINEHEGYAAHLAELIAAEFLIIPRSDIVGSLEQEWALGEVTESPYCEPEGQIFDSLNHAEKGLEKQRGAWRSGGRPIRYRIITRWRTEWRPWSVIPLPSSEQQVRHTWECMNRTRIGVPSLDACDCSAPLPENGEQS